MKLNLKQNAKKPLLVAAAVATVTAASLGIGGAVSAATDTSSTSTDGNPMSALVEKIASKFNLSTAEVQAVFDADRSEHETQMKADRTERIAAAVTAGTLTQEQADHITTALEEIDALRGDGNPQDEDDTAREQMRSKMNELRTWAEAQNLELRDIIGGHGGHGGPGGMGGPRGGSDDSNDDTSSTSDSSSDSSESSTSST